MDQLIEKLRAAVGRENVLAERDELLVYECDGLTQHKHPPRAVVFPSSTGQVAAVVRELARAGVSFAPRGAGTGLSGGALAVGGGVVVEMARMRRLLKLDVENRIAVVETGMVNEQVSRAVSAEGLHYVPDPSSGRTCTVGGNIAENAGGIHCLKYGVTTDHVLAARVVLSDGRVVDLGSPAGVAAGYDLLGVFVGSEGTFGIATEATVRLVPLPQAVRTLLADFADVDDASRAVSAIIAEGLVPAALEMMDAATIGAVEASVFAAGLPTDAGAALLIELDGLEAGIDDEARRAASICREHGARGVRRAADERERKKLWAARKGAFGAMGRLAPDMMIQDAVVPRSRLPEILAETYRISSEYRLKLANVFHAGDGNLHPFISFDRRDADELRRVEEAGSAIMRACVRAGGTITGEHGVGLDKSAYLPLIFSDDDMDAMLAVRAAFDPSSLCNPGKIIPAPRGCGEARAIAAALTDNAEHETGGRNRDASAGTFAAFAARHDAQALPSVPLPVGGPEGAATSNASASSSTRTSTASAAAQTPAPHRHDRARAARGIVEIGRLFAGALGDDGVGVVNGRVTVAPATVEEACEALKLASREGVSVVPTGAGLWLGRQRNTSDGRAVVLSTRKLDRIAEHSPADLVVTAEAGVPLSKLNAELARARQWLPLDPPDDGRATVGGVVSTGLGGALSAAYGAPRAHLLGARALLADGRQVRSGGRVVKNVAGYDLTKLFAGSRGTLCLLAELTFKLRPQPERTATVVARGDDATNLFAAARGVVAGRLLPASVELLSPRAAWAVGLGEESPAHAALVRFAGTSAAVAWQTEQALPLFTPEQLGARPELIEDDAQLWASVASLQLRGGAALRWRASVLPSHLPGLLPRLNKAAAHGGSLSWHAGVSDGRLRVSHGRVEDSRELVVLLQRLREIARQAGGSLVVEETDVEGGASLADGGFDRWGVGEDDKRLMRSIKNALDPRGTFPPVAFDVGG